MGPAALGVTDLSGLTQSSRPVEYENVTTILLTSSTKYKADHGQGGSARALKVGSFIVAQGTLSADGKTLTASLGRLGGHHGACDHGKNRKSRRAFQ